MSNDVKSDSRSPSNLTLTDIHHLVMLADELNYVRAAERLHISQPSLSQAVQRVERRLGTKLFDRSTRRTTLTPAGLAFIDGARRLLADVKRLQVDTQSIGSGRLGVLRLGAVNPAFRTLLPRILRTIRAEFPSLRVELHPLPSQQQMRSLLDGHLDAGILRTADDRPELTSMVLINEPLYAVLPADSDLAKRQDISLADLAGQTFIMAPRDRNPAYYDELLGLYRQNGAAPSELLEAANMHAQFALVGAGYGVSVQPLLFVDRGRDDVVFAPLKSERLRIPLRIVHHTTQRSDVLDRFVVTARSEAQRLLEQFT